MMQLDDWKFQGRVSNVVDADTLDVRVELGFGLVQTQRFRITNPDDTGFDAPESWRPKYHSEREHGNKAKAFVEKHLQNKRVVLRSIKKGKYRYVAVVYFDMNGTDTELTELLVKNGFEKLSEQEYIDMDAGTDDDWGPDE